MRICSTNPSPCRWNCRITAELPDLLLNSIVSCFSHTGFDGSIAFYQATLVSWFWFLTRTSDCRIFQDRTVLHIVKDIFRKHGYTDFQEFRVEPIPVLELLCAVSGDRFRVHQLDTGAGG